MNDVCSEKKNKIKNPCKNTFSPWWEPDEVWCAQWKLTDLPSSGMKKQPRRNGVYQTNDGNSRKLCAVLVRGRASVDDADTGKVQRQADGEMRSRRGRGRPDLGGRLREENPKTAVHETHMGTQPRTKNSFTSCHTRSDNTSYGETQGQSPRKMWWYSCNEKHPKTKSACIKHTHTFWECRMCLCVCPNQLDK